MSYEREAAEEILKGIKLMIDKAFSGTTSIYNGLILSQVRDNIWSVKYNGEVHSVKSYDGFAPELNSVVKVIVPQGNNSLAYFVSKGTSLPSGGKDGDFLISDGKGGSRWETLINRAEVGA